MKRKKTKVMVYLTSYPPHRYVGGELMTADLLEHLVVQGHEVTVFADRIGEGYTRNGVTVRNAGYIAHHTVKEFDVFITHPEIRANVWHYTHDMPYIGIVHNLRSETIRSLNRVSPDMTIVNSTWAAGHMPLSVQLNNLGVQVIKPPILMKPCPDWSPEYVTLINLSFDKGVDVFAHLAARNPQQMFIGVKGGYGEQREGFTDNVLVNTHTPDIDHIYNRTKVLVVPSRHETYGKVVVEAMSWGIPVIASDLPGLHEAGGGAAIYVDPTDYTGWNDTLKELLHDSRMWEERSQMSRDRANDLLSGSHHDLAAWEGLVRHVASRS